MAQYLLTTVEGSTAPLQFQLLQGGFPLPLSGSTVTLSLRRPDGIEVQTAGKVTIFDAANGKVQFTPAAADLVALGSPYVARWKVVDGSGAIQYVPSTTRDEWEILSL